MNCTSQLNIYNTKPIRGFNWTGIEEYDALISVANNLFSSITCILAMVALFTATLVLEHAMITKTPRCAYWIGLLAQTLHMFGTGLSLTAVYFGIPTPFGGRTEKILPASREASLEGPNGWPCYLKRHFEAVLAYWRRDGIYDGAAVDAVQANVRWYGMTYLLCIVVPLLVVRIVVVANKKLSRMPRKTYSPKLVDVGKYSRMY
jgi:hypothetical protein